MTPDPSLSAMDTYEVAEEIGNIADYFGGQPYSFSFTKGPHTPKSEQEEAALLKLVELGFAKVRKGKAE